MIRERKPWVNRLIVLLLVTAPLVMWFVLQTVVMETRAGNVDEVWFADTAAGPLLVSRDSVVVGTEHAAKRRFRVAVVDLRTGERLAREKVDGMLDLAGVSEGALWFRDRKQTDGALHARAPTTLEPLEKASGTPAKKVEERKGFVPLKPEVEVPGIGPVKPSFNAGEVLLDSTTTAPIVLEEPRSYVVVHRPEEPGTSKFLVSRVSAEGKTLWTEPLDRQRWLRAAHVADGKLVIVTAGIARDFAIALDVKTGAKQWIHNF